MKTLSVRSGVILTALMLGAIFYSIAAAADWKYCCTNGLKDQYYLDRESVVYLEKGIVRVWRKIDCRESKDSKVDEFLEQIEYDCRQRMERTLYSKISYREGGIGFLQESKWGPIEPDTIFESFFKAVCKEGNKR